MYLLQTEVNVEIHKCVRTCTDDIRNSLVIVFYVLNT